MTQYLRHKSKGTIYSWNTELAKNPNIEAVSEEEAFPERFVPKAQKGRKPKLNVTTEVPEPPAIEFPEINADASKGLL